MLAAAKSKGFKNSKYQALKFNTKNITIKYLAEIIPSQNISQIKKALYGFLIRITPVKIRPQNIASAIPAISKYCNRSAKIAPHISRANIFLTFTILKFLLRLNFNRTVELNILIVISYFSIKVNGIIFILFALS